MAAKQSWFARLFGGASAGPAEASWADGQAILDDFVVEGKLGQGGMGAVYLLRNRSTGQPFAVKRALLRDAGARRNFLGELQAWIDLPEHPHLAAYRFFRTIGDEVAVFAEYLDGGSLEAAIRGHTLTRLEDILDVAIQFAWGLHAVHEWGLVHQDVKPGNVLLTAGGVAKVSDFGLARARAAAGDPGAPADQSILVSCGGMTPAYCSPEQAAGKPLTRRTDVWSWGVSVLEMFTGEVTWPKGTVAAEALDEYLAGRLAGPRPAMPAGVAVVLRRCFRKDPAERWASMAEVADRLCRVYGEEVHKDYPRPVPLSPSRAAEGAVEYDRHTAAGGGWHDPRLWLRRALQLAGRNPDEAEALALPRGATRKAQATADLAAYEEAGRILEGLVAHGYQGLETHRGRLWMGEAFVHESLDDLPGAVALYDRAIALYEPLVRDRGWRHLAHDLILAYLHKALAVHAQGNERAAAAICDEALAVCEPLVQQGGRHDLSDDLAWTYATKGLAVQGLGAHRDALALYDRAIALYEPPVRQQGRPERADKLAGVYVNKANSLSSLADRRAAEGLYGQAIALYEPIVRQQGQRHLADKLARTLVNRANLLVILGDNRSALGLYDQAIGLWEELVQRDGRGDLTHNLAEAYVKKSGAASALGDYREAGRLLERAIPVYERLVNQEDRRELAHHLATAYGDRAYLLIAQRDGRAALALLDRALPILERLAGQEDSPPDVRNSLAGTCAMKADVLSGLGERRAAVALYDRALPILERLVHEEGQRWLVFNLAGAYVKKAGALSALDDHRGALALHDRAVALHERLVEQEQQPEFRGDWARALVFRAVELAGLGERERARADVARAVPVLRAEAARTRRADLQMTLQWATTSLQALL